MSLAIQYKIYTSQRPQQFQSSNNNTVQPQSTEELTTEYPQNTALINLGVDQYLTKQRSQNNQLIRRRLANFIREISDFNKLPPLKLLHKHFPDLAIHTLSPDDYHALCGTGRACYISPFSKEIEYRVEQFDLQNLSPQEKQEYLEYKRNAKKIESKYKINNNKSYIVLQDKIQFDMVELLHELGHHLQYLYHHDLPSQDHVVNELLDSGTFGLAQEANQKIMNKQFKDLTPEEIQVNYIRAITEYETCYNMYKALELAGARDKVIYKTLEHSAEYASWWWVSMPWTNPPKLLS